MNNNRPLSPHLQIYRWEWTMSYSILHRVTGVIIFLGLAVFSLWLFSLAFHPSLFRVIDFFSSIWLFQIAIWGWVWALFYHLSNGIRHLIWDSGKWLELPQASWSGHFGFLLSLLLTGLNFIFWLV